jgi:cytochrome d ubiquinol oxidase subunit I
MSNTALWLSAFQFFLSYGFMALFIALELGLAWALFYFKVRALWSGNAAWTEAYRFWVRVFALAFFLGLAGSMPVLIQFGSLWPTLMPAIGEVAGPLLAAAILTTFIFKSCFLGAMLFGQRYVSDRVHTLIVFVVAAGCTLALFWVVALQSWMQTPTGASLIEGRYYTGNWVHIIFNPSLPWYGAQVALLAVLTTVFMMLGVIAGQTFLRPLVESERLVFRTALVVAAVCVVLQGWVGLETQSTLVHYQPARMAATDAYWHSGTPPDLVLLAWPDEDSSSNRAAWVWHGAAGPWLGHEAKTGYQGLDHFAGMSPPVALTYWLFRLMLLIGLIMALVSWLTWWRVHKRLYDPGSLSQSWRKVLRGMTFSGWVACAAALGYAVVGMFPYVVNDTITLRDVAGGSDAGTLLAAMAVYLVFYGVLLWGFLGLLQHVARYGVVPVARRRGRA